MPALSWTEIRDRATAFARRWKDTTREQAESQPFWTEFLATFGVDRKRAAEFEKKVQLKRGRTLSNGRIDLFWPGKLLVEMKDAASGFGPVHIALCHSVIHRPLPAARQ